MHPIKEDSIHCSAYFDRDRVFLSTTFLLVASVVAQSLFQLNRLEEPVNVGRKKLLSNKA